MRRVSVSHVAALLGLCTALGSTAGAQANTGASSMAGKDNNWSVACTFTIAHGGCYSGSAFLVTTPPAPPWKILPSTTWISTSSSATVSGAKTSDNANNYQYIFSQAFASTSAPLTMQVFTDNFLTGYSLNGGAVMSVSPDPSPGDFNQTSPRLFVLPTGTTRIALYSHGDGTTDGVDVAFSSVPEPSSMALLGTGLIGLVPMIRRRRKS